MSLVLNNTPMEGVNVNGQKMERVFVNAKLIFEDVVRDIVSGSSGFSIRDFIDRNFPGKKKVEITLRGIHGPIRTDDLSGLDVTIINEGEVQGMTMSNGTTVPALKLTSSITLKNQGWIKAAGGYGGKGAKGPNDTYVKKHKVKVSYWKAREISASEGYVEIYENGNLVRRFSYSSGSAAMNEIGPLTYNGKTYTRTGAPIGYAINAKSYYYYKEWDETLPRTGGEGGDGGVGQAYGRAAQSGANGTPSSPTGGYSGGKGGTGGSWGKAGAKGSDVASSKGSAGNLPGYAIEGITNITIGSKIGSIIGITK